MKLPELEVVSQNDDYNTFKKLASQPDAMVMEDYVVKVVRDGKMSMDMAIGFSEPVTIGLIEGFLIVLFT